MSVEREKERGQPSGSENGFLGSLVVRARPLSSISDFLCGQNKRPHHLFLSHSLTSFMGHHLTKASDEEQILKHLMAVLSFLYSLPLPLLYVYLTAPRNCKYVVDLLSVGKICNSQI